MNISLILLMNILFFSFLYRKNYSIIFLKHKVNLKIIYLCIIFIILFFYSAFRGDFTQDYTNYCVIFNVTGNSDWSSIFSNYEFLYTLLMKLTYMINTNPVYFFTVNALLLLIPYYIVIRTESYNYVISLLIFVIMDNYLISYNLMRNILAVGYYLYAMKYIYEKNPIRYFALVILISFIHKSAIFMLMNYYILNVDFRKKKNLIVLLFILTLSPIILLNVRPILLFLQGLVGYEYTEISYGMDSGSLVSTIKFLIMFTFILFNINKINLDNIKERVFFNSCIVCVVLQIMSLNLFMIQRIMFYYSGTFIILIPIILSRIRNNELLILYKFSFIAFAFIISIARSSNYYFYLDNKRFIISNYTNEREVSFYANNDIFSLFNSTYVTTLS